MKYLVSSIILLITLHMRWMYLSIMKYFLKLVELQADHSGRAV
jgi:hypothetical protein